MLNSRLFFRCAVASSALLLAVTTTHAQLRIASYNIEADIGGYTTPRPGLDTVLQGIGTDSFGGFARPLDILGLEETTSNATTVAPIVTNLNTFYGAGTYAQSSYQGTVSGGDPSGGNGPNALIYNTHTLTLIASVGVGTPSGSSEARQEIRYQFRPNGYGSNADFYIYVGHFKSGSDSTGTNNSQARRNIEANLVRGDAATLAAGSRIIYSGDFNPFNGSAEPEWVTMTTTGTGTLSSNTTGIDPINLGNGTWGSSNSAFKAAYTDSTTSLKYRDDLQLSTAPVNDGHGFSIINGTYHPFSNNNNVSISAGSSNPSVKTASDHYPLVADYRLPAMMNASVAAVPSTVIVGASVPVNVSVSNSAPVAVAIGADTLNYTIASNGSLSGSANVVGVSALTSANVSALSLDASTVGLHSGTVSVNSSSQEVANGAFSQAVSTNVIDHAHPTLDKTSINFGVYGRGLGGATASFSIGNAIVATQSAGLDLDSAIATGSTGDLSSNVAPFSNLAAGGLTQYAVSLAANSNGTYSTSYALNFSDQNLPGAVSLGTQTITLTAIIATPGDADLSGHIDANDYSHIDTGYQSQHTPGFAVDWFSGDFNRDGVIDANDYALIDTNYQLQNGGAASVDHLLDWLVAGDPNAPLIGIDPATLRLIEGHEAEFGAAYVSAFAYAVPEPASIAVAAFVLPVLFRRRRATLSRQNS